MSDSTLSIIIFVLVMIVIISEKVHRAVVAVGGAVLLIILGVLDIEHSVAHIDYNTIGLLIGMMLFVAVVKNSGMFEYLAVKSAKVAKGDPWRMMVIFIIITAVLSALLDNVTTVLLVGPMTLAITKEMELNPVPFILTQILASNIGGTATLIGDPPNIMIGSATGLSFADFVLNDGVIVVVVMIATILGFKLIYGKKLIATPEAIQKVMAMDEKSLIRDHKLLIKSVVMIILIVAGFALHGVLHMESSIIALTGAVIMMIIGRQDIEKVVLDVEWPTIIFFTALFIVVGGMVETGVIDDLADIIMGVTDGKPVMTMMIILWVSAILSSTLDNIPFVATMIPLIQAMGEGGMDVMPLWWALSLGACLGGNGTLIGASANVVLTGISGKHGYPITYVQFLKIGFPMMILSIAICSVYMLIRYV
ncbi:MAG: SLC13 family permease [Anaerovoracaceae bacterium]